MILIIDLHKLLVIHIMPFVRYFHSTVRAELKSSEEVPRLDTLIHDYFNDQFMVLT